MAWNRPENGEAASSPLRRKCGASAMKRRGRRFPIVVAGAIAVIVAAVAWFVLSPPEETRQDAASAKKALIKEVMPVKASKGAPPTERKTKHVLTEREKRIQEGSRKALARKREFEERMRTDAQLIFHVTNNVKVKNGGYKTTVEQMLDWIFSCEVGAMPPLPPVGIPAYELAAIGEILDNELPAVKGESEEAVKRRELMREVKDELRKYIADGGDPQKFLEYYHDQLVRAYERRQDAGEALLKSCKEDDPEVARMMHTAVNQLLEKDGIKKIELRKDQRQRIGLTEKEEN